MSSPFYSVSVVIPLYNHEHYINSALESVYAQSMPPEEVIIIDDNSQDASLSIAQKFATSHSKTIVLHSPTNRGAHYAINSGIQISRGDIISILNSDDIYAPNRLAECQVLFSNEPSLDVICTGLSFIDKNGEKTKNTWYEQARAFYNQVNDLSLALINGNFFMTTSNIIARRSVFDQIGYFSALRYAHDLDFFLRLELRGKHIKFYDKPLLSYRVHPANTIKEDQLKVKVEWAAATAFFIYNNWQRKRNWEYYSRLSKITDRHNLTYMLMYFFAFFASLPPDELTCDAFKHDEEFSRFIHSVVR